MENQISDLFTRCPKCRSFSIQNQNYLENNKTSLKNKFFCSNCNHKFSSKVEKSIPEEKIPEKPIQEETIFENKNPVEKTYNNKRYLTFAVFSIILTITVFAFVINQKKPKNLKGDNLKKGINAEQIVNIDQNKANQTNTVQTNDDQKKPLITNQQKDLSESKRPDTEDIEIKKSNIDKVKIQKFEAMPKLTNRTSIKAINLNYLRVRKSHALESDPAFRWKFKTETITIRRENNQKVYIAGNSSGTKKWMVDDALYINGKKFQGWEIEPENIGVIPHECRRKPLDITNMVPPEKDINLNIKLIDYGKFWGNTSIYVVVK